MSQEQKGTIYHGQPVKDILDTADPTLSGGGRGDEEESEGQKLSELENQANTVLYKLSTVFPFTLFPTEISVDELKVNVLHRTFFFASQVNAIYIKDVINVRVETSLFFATMIIERRWFADEPVEVRYLRKNEAMEALKIIQGLMIGAEHSVDFSKIDAEEIRHKVRKIGEPKVAI